jgi:molecular chaperone HscB
LFVRRKFRCMTDFFALFEQPRRPWLDPRLVKEKYLQLTRVAHPDVNKGESDISFETINEAYRVLSEPKLRIQHLLALEGQSRTAVDRALPEDLQRLFLQIAELSQKTQRLHTSATSALAISLTKNEVSELRSQLEQLLDELTRAFEKCLGELREMNQIWDTDRATALLQLQTLHHRLSYLSRWIEQLKEMQFQLAT